MRIPDYLSGIWPTTDKEIELDLMIYIVDIRAQKQMDLQHDTEEDEKSKILNGWSEDIKDMPKLIRNNCSW